MNIAMISVHECPLASSEGKERGGINVYVYELSKALTRLGHTVDMFTRMQDSVNPATVRVNDRARVIHIPAGPKTSIPKREVFRYLSEFSRNMTDFIRKDGVSYDIFHAHYYYSGIVTDAVREALSTASPMIMTFHTLGLMKELTAPSRSGDPAERIPAEMWLAGNASSFISTSDNDAAYLSALYNVPSNRIVSIPPGVDTRLFTHRDKTEARMRIGVPRDSKTILSVGRIDPVKGFDVLLYALKILRHNDPELSRNVCMMIVGGEVEENKRMWNKELKKLDGLRRTLGLETAVRFIPAQKQESLPDYYNAADVLVLASHYESFGMVALEALSCGTPVIATDVTGISPFIKAVPKGHIVSADNPIMLAHEISHVLKHAPYTGKETEQVVTDLTWDKTAEKIAASYASLQRHPQL